MVCVLEMMMVVQAAHSHSPNLAPLFPQIDQWHDEGVIPVPVRGIQYWWEKVLTIRGGAVRAYDF